MKKIFILIALLFLSGCTVNYNLEIEDNNIKENINGDIYKNEFDPIDDIYGDHNIYYLIYDNQSPFDNSQKLYNKSIKEEDDGRIIFDASYNYDGDYDKSRIINNCYENHLFKETDNTYIIKLSGSFYCQYASVINVKVKTNNYVIDNNADEIDNNVYTWKISNNDSDIKLIISKKVKNEDVISDDNTNYLRIISLGVLLALLLVIFFIYKKHKNSN